MLCWPLYFQVWDRLLWVDVQNQSLPPYTPLWWTGTIGLCWCEQKRNLRLSYLPLFHLTMTCIYTHFKKKVYLLMQILHCFKLSWSLYFEWTLGELLQQTSYHCLQLAQHVSILKKKAVKEFLQLLSKHFRNNLHVMIKERVFSNRSSEIWVL